MWTSRYVAGLSNNVDCRGRAGNVSRTGTTYGYVRRDTMPSLWSLWIEDKQGRWASYQHSVVGLVSAEGQRERHVAAVAGQRRGPLVHLRHEGARVDVPGATQTTSQMTPDLEMHRMLRL